MPNYRRARTEGGTFFFTVVTYHRQPILCRGTSVKTLREVVKEVAMSHPFHIDAWVLLPNHIHCIWTLPEGDTDYSTRWALIKKKFTGRATRFIKPCAVPSQSREKHREGTIWQRRFWEHQIRDEEDYRAHLDYIHFNPVKHGLVKRPADWRHSTFHRYVSQGWYEETWGSEYVLPAEGIGHE